MNPDLQAAIEAWALAHHQFIEAHRLRARALRLFDEAPAESQRTWAVLDAALGTRTTA